MNNIHNKIINLLKNDIILCFDFYKNNFEQNLDIIKRKIFKNYRTNPEKGLLLTDLGYFLLKKKLQHWEFTKEDINNINMKHLLWLEKHSNFPYYINFKEHKLCVFCPEISMFIKLYGNDIENLSKNYYKK